MLKMDDPRQPSDKARPTLNVTDGVSSSQRAPPSPEEKKHLSHQTYPEVSESDDSESDDGTDEEGEPETTKKGASPISSTSPSKTNLPAVPLRREDRLSSGTIPPDLLLELRKIIREENRAIVKQEVTEQLHKGGDKASGPATAASPLEARPASFYAFTPESSPATRQSSLVLDRTKDSSPRTSAARLAGSNPQSPTVSQTSISPRASPSVRFSEMALTASKTSRKESIVIEPTALDHKWGTLFDADGHPTKRLEQVLRGLANYIIDEFMPQRSIVVTPEKLAAFYSYHRLEAEPHPFAALFSRPATTSSAPSSPGAPQDFDERLGELFQDLDCQYHLVQAGGDVRSRPRVPGLTPAGFARWMATCARAYPDEEARRLERVVAAFPITAEAAGDGLPERLPRHISRRLLPARPNRKVRQVLDEAVEDFMEDTAGPPADPRRSSSSVFRTVGGGGGSGRTGSGADRRASEVSPRSRYAHPTTSEGEAPLSPGGNPRASESSIGGKAGSGRDSARRTSSNAGRYEPQPQQQRPVTGRLPRTVSDDTPRSSQGLGVYIPPPPIGRTRSGSAYRERLSSRDLLSDPAVATLHGSSPTSPSGAFELSGGRERDRDDGGHRRYGKGGRGGVEESTPRAEMVAESGRRGGNRRSLVVAEDRGPTFEEVFRSQEPRKMR